MTSNIVIYKSFGKETGCREVLATCFFSLVYGGLICCK